MKQQVVHLPSRQPIGNYIESARPIFNCEIKPKELTNPLMLGNCREPLIQQELQCKMICAHNKLSAPQIRTPVPNCLDKADEFPLICG